MGKKRNNWPYFESISPTDFILGTMVQHNKAYSMTQVLMTNWPYLGCYFTHRLHHIYYHRFLWLIWALPSCDVSSCNSYSLFPNKSISSASLRMQIFLHPIDIVDSWFSKASCIFSRKYWTVSEKVYTLAQLHSMFYRNLQRSLQEGLH